MSVIESAFSIAYWHKLVFRAARNVVACFQIRFYHLLQTCEDLNLDNTTTRNSILIRFTKFCLLLQYIATKQNSRRSCLVSDNKTKDYDTHCFPFLAYATKGSTLVDKIWKHLCSTTKASLTWLGVEPCRKNRQVLLRTVKSPYRKSEWGLNVYECV